MGIYSFKLPDLGEGVVESEVIAWHVAPGDAVAEDQHIADVMTDKATVEVSAPIDGVVVALGCAAGTILHVGQELIRFEVAGTGNVDASAPAVHAEQPAATAPAETPAPQPRPLPQPAKSAQPSPATRPAVPVAGSAPVPASKPITPLYPHRALLTSPSIRRLAQQEGADLSMVPGSGPDGRITRTDLETFLANRDHHGSGGRTAPRTGSETTRLSGLRRVIARKISAAKRNIPHYSYIDEVDVGQLEGLRQKLNAQRQPHQPKLTLLPFIIRAMVKTLPQFPHCNATFDGESDQLTQYEGVHVGIATMTDQGLAVPVVRHCESLDLWQLAAQISRLSDAVRNQNAKPEELSGSTITVTSLGTLGGLATTPVINAPETAIIGVNKMQWRPVVNSEGAIVARQMMNISASFDHRIVDGYDGAQLVQALKRLLESPAELFI